MVMSKERIAQLRQELAQNPHSRQFYQLGELLRREGELTEAVTVLRQGLQHQPRYVAAWVSLGRALLDLQDLEEAQKALEKALEFDPQNPVAWRLLGEAFLGLGRRREALRAFEHALALVPGDEVLEQAVATLRADQVPPEPAGEGSLLPPPPPVAELNDTAAPPPPEAAEDIAQGLPSPPPLSADAVFDVPFEPPPLLAGDVITGGEFAWAPEPAEALPPSETPGTGTGEPFGEVLPEPLGAPPRADVAPLPGRPQTEVERPMPPPEQPPILEPHATLAEARLAVHQGNLAAAASTLENLLRVEPENQEAADLLALVHDMMEPLPPEEPKLSLRERKIASLQRFLANVTLARERLRL